MKRPMFLLFGFLFILSGITSLVYETLWIRVLSLGVGSTSASISMVLAIFFFGMSVGSYLAGKYINRIKNPLLLYGIIEGAIGIYAIAVIYPLIHFHHVLAVLPLSGAFSWFGVFAKFLLVFLFLAIPTIGMGATLPLLVRVFVRNNQKVGRWISVLYGINTIGAAVGAAITGFALIPSWGILQTNHTVALVNLAIMGVIFAMRNRAEVVESGALDDKAGMKKSLSFASLSFVQKSVLISVGVTGFAAIASQVVWSKYLGVFFGTNVYGLGLVLSLYLLGIALGSFFLSMFIHKIKNKISFFVTLLLLSSITTILTSYLFNLAPTVANVSAYYLGDSVNLLTIKSLITIGILFFPTALSGAMLPLAVNILSDEAATAPRAVGLSYSINTIGSILGSYFAGMILIPYLGSSAAIQISAFLLAAVATAFVFAGKLTVVRQTVYSVAISLSVIIIFMIPKLDFRNIIKSAYFQYASEDMSLNEVLKYFSRDYEEFKFIYEGKTAIISLSHDKQDGEVYKDYYRLKTNGLNESVYNRKNLDEYPKYEALLGFLPYALADNPKKAFIVGYGGGYTVDVLTSMQDLDQVYVAELEEGIIKASQFVYKDKNPILKRPNLKLEINDARYVLAAKLDGPYDIVVSQPSQSWLSGVANLFTKEFFEIVSDNLNEGGVYCQWLNLYNMNVPVLKSVLRTFYTVFPHGAVFTNHDDQELLMVGSKKEIRLNSERINEIIARPRVKDFLALAPIASVEDLLSNFSVDRNLVLNATKGSVINTDINAYAEVNQSALFYSSRELKETPQDYLSSIFDAEFKTILGELDKESLNTNYYNLLVSLLNQEKYDKFQMVLSRYEKNAEEDPRHLWNLGYLCLRAQRYASALKYLMKAFGDLKNSEVFNLLLSSLEGLNRHEEMIQYALKYPKLRDQTTDCYLLRAYVQTNRRSSASQLGLRMTRGTDRYRQQCGDYFDKVMGEYWVTRHSYRKAVPFLESYYEKASDDVENLERLIISYFKVGDSVTGREFAAYLSTAVESAKKNDEDLANYYESLGLRDDARAIMTHWN